MNETLGFQSRTRAALFCSFLTTVIQLNYYFIDIFSAVCPTRTFCHYYNLISYVNVAYNFKVTKPTVRTAYFTSNHTTQQQ